MNPDRAETLATTFNVSREKIAQILDKSLQLVEKTAVNNNGTIFGGYVRDHIIPKHYDPVNCYLFELRNSVFGKHLDAALKINKELKLNVDLSKTLDQYVDHVTVTSLATVYKLTTEDLAKLTLAQVVDTTQTYCFKDIDIWFSTKEKADAFWTELKPYLKHSELQNVINSHNINNVYPFQREQYVFYIESKDDSLVRGTPFSIMDTVNLELFYIDVIVYDLFPVNDFDVNLLTWDGPTRTLGVNEPCCVSLHEIYKHDKRHLLTVEKLTNNVLNKTISVFPEYKELARDRWFGRGNSSSQGSANFRMKKFTKYWKVVDF